MICLEEHLLQKYIDGQCTENEKAEIKQHLSVCPVCTHKKVEKETLASAIIGALNSLRTEAIEVPVFKNRKTSSYGKNYKLIIYSLSAACMLLLVLFFVDKNVDPQPKEMTIVQSVLGEVDANRPASEQEFVIQVFDGKGHASEYFIE